MTLKRVLCAVLAAALACGLCGCARSEESSAQPDSVNNLARTNPIIDDETTSKSEAPAGKFDWDKALSEFYLNDIKIEYPFSESSLGEDYEFDDEPIYNEFGDYLTIVVDRKDHQGMWFFEAVYKGVTKETYTPDLVPDRIYSLLRPSVQGIKENTPRDNVYAIWGEPDETEEGKHFNSAIYYGKEEGQKLYLYFDKTKDTVKLIEIDFTNMHEETENSDEPSAVEIKPQIEMDGQLITIPCKVKDIKNITIDREYSFAVVPASENVDEYSGAFFYYNGIRAGIIRLEGDCSQKTVLDEETVVGFDLYADIPFSYYGVTPESNRDDIIKVLGEPDEGYDTLLKYYIDGNPADQIHFDLNYSDSTVHAVYIYLGMG